MSPPLAPKKKPAAGPAAGLIISLVLLILALPSCASPNRYLDKLKDTQVVTPGPRRLLLTFESESRYAALSHKKVSISVKAPATLLSPASGQGTTNAQGQLEVVIEPIGIYDRKALKGGDIVVDYPAELTVALSLGSTIYEWDLDGHDSFARYGDPLYRGLDRDPDPAALHLTLTIP
jgi:hypothetical protein